jgi:hypothetical protein
MIAKIGHGPFVLVVESLNQKTGVSEIYPEKILADLCTSLALNLELGFWSVSLPPNTDTWERPKKASCSFVVAFMCVNIMF